MKSIYYCVCCLFFFVLVVSVTRGSQIETEPPLNPSIPTKIGEKFVVDDWDNKITINDLGFNYFSGNMGTTETVEGATTLGLSDNSNNSNGNSLEVSFNFTDQPQEVFAGFFSSLFGLTDTKVSLDGSGTEPNKTTAFSGYYLDMYDLYRRFMPLSDRTIDELRFDIRLESLEDIILKIQLQDVNNIDVFTRRTISNDGNDWNTVTLLIPDDFDDSVSGNENTEKFDWHKVRTFSLVIERVNIGAGIINPDTGRFIVDNLLLVDTDGEYPDLNQISLVPGGTLDPYYEEAFLDLVRSRSFLYFLDWASTDPNAGGIIQDRSTYADLLSVGGVGFQLSAYIIGAERSYISREEAADRTLRILQTLSGKPQGPARVGTIGYKGFFYHFVGIDGLRKHNFDFTDTPTVDESLNTVELSTIDTALALCGVLIARQYYTQNTTIEIEIRNLSYEIYERVNWNFMLNKDAGPKQNQFYLGWKPNEENEGPDFKIPDPNGLGQYSGNPGEPATVDYYTDEGLLIALLAMSSPNPNHRVDREVWDAMIRDKEGGTFVKTYPGTLFTYQFASVWLNTHRLSRDNHPNTPVDFFENTKRAIEATQDYAVSNPLNRTTLNHHRWGLTATEGPFDSYFAEAAPPAAIHWQGNEPMGEAIGSGGPFELECEAGTGDGDPKPRGNASGSTTVLLKKNESRILSFALEGTARYEFKVQYSNDGATDNVRIDIDGEFVGLFITEDTRPAGGGPGTGWNEFKVSPVIGYVNVAPGQHSITITIKDADYYGVEIDMVMLKPVSVLRPLEVGTVTNYAIASSILHTPSKVIEALWNNARQEDLNQNGIPELLHTRFGFADAFNLNIADAVIAGVVDPNEQRILRAEGPWASYVGFSIDHGPMLTLIDNYLNDQFIPQLFMSHPNIRDTLSELFLLPDIDHNTTVDMSDFIFLAKYWLEENCGTCGGADIMFDGQLNLDDLKEFVAYWLEGG